MTIALPAPSRYIIDLHPRDLFSANKYSKLLQRIRDLVLSKRENAANQEEKQNKDVLNENPGARVNWHHKNFLAKWWLLSYPRPKLIQKISLLSRYIVCSRTTRRGIFEFVDPSIRPGDALQIFLFVDDYSFGILQSSFHWDWFNERCSTLKRDFR